jgi:hypothetical protein
MTTTEPGDRLISDELVRLFDLVRGSDSVESKLTVPETAHRSTVNALGLDLRRNQARREVDVSGERQTETRTALEFSSRDLRDERTTATAGASA